jgi:hypothetical protein
LGNALGLPLFKLSKTIDPTCSRAMSSGRIDDARALANWQRLKQGHGLLGLGIVQAQNHHIRLLHAGKLGRRIFALGRIDAEQLKILRLAQALSNLQARGSRLPIDENFMHETTSPMMEIEQLLTSVYWQSLKKNPGRDTFLVGKV